ncbi:epidermal growth factor receptor kinase substrate 8-like isoform X3 [Lytechinus pictus]|uniref:epidermal growth factor receptor kinase substrate 8-like isoform X3 n=1 Tax=Lytechinus pictus TaxID=7653 RepID=UPI0030B9AFB7
MPIPTGRQNPYVQESPYGHHGGHHPQTNGQMDRSHIPNGYPTGNGRQNGVPHEGPSRGANNNNHKGHYGVYGDPRHLAEQPSRDKRRPVSYPNGHPPQEYDPSRRPVSYQQGHHEPQPHPHGHAHQQQPHPKQQAHVPSHHHAQPQHRSNRFPVEHLYTFAMDKKDGVVSVEDGIRKLRILDAKGKIWSQDVRLMVTEKEVVLMDEYTQETLEVFPLQDIGAVSAELKQCNYDSLLVIIVRYTSKRVPEMMMFQCEQISAPDIARSLQKAVDYHTSGKKKKQHRSEHYGMVPGGPSQPQMQSQAQVHGDDRRMAYDADNMFIPPPPDEPAPPPPIDVPGNVKNKVAAFAAAAAAAQGYLDHRVSRTRISNGNGISPRGFQSPKSAPVRSAESEEPIELLAMRTERDVEILNHCFDDIEAFIGRLQKAAEAYTELSRRRQTRKNRRREHGDGLLLARSRPPTDGEYIECFQKFKYCFNLLAKLKAHIHDPNAPELVHFLFVPLKLIIQSCQGPELAASVVSPLLSPQAVDLLQNCLTSRENELWMSLGRAWTLPSTEWPKDRPVSRYVPRFRDGWTPRPITEPQTHQDFNTSVLVNNASVAASAAAVARESPRRLSERSDQADGPVFGHNHQRQPSNDSGHIANGPIIHSNGPNAHSNGPSTHTNGPATHTNGPIGHSHGPSIHANGNGYHQRQTSDPLAHSPRTSAVPTPPPPAPKPVSSPTPTRPGAKMATAIFDFVARNFKELTIMADEQLEVLNDQRKWWEVRNTSGQSGYVPSTLLKITSPSPNTNTNSNHVPEPPNTLPPPPPSMSTFGAPPPPPPPPPADGSGRPNSTQKANGMDFATQLQNTLKNKQLRPSKTQDRALSSSSQYDTLQEELKNRVSNGGKAKNYRIPRRSISDVSLTYDSGRDDVKRWLESKGFSPMTVHSLGILNGAQLFSLTKEELQQVCHDDGSRVYSQLMIQKAALQRGPQMSHGEVTWNLSQRF